MHMIGRGDHYRINTIGAIGFSIGHLDERGVTPLFGQVPIPRGRFGAGGIRGQRPSHDLPAVRQPRRHCLSMRYSPSTNNAKAQAAGLRGVGTVKVKGHWQNRHGSKLRRDRAFGQHLNRHED